MGSIPTIKHLDYLLKPVENSLSILYNSIVINGGNEMKTYIVNYREYASSKVCEVEVFAKNRYDAYDKVTYEMLDFGRVPYSSWVVGYKRKDGSIHYFLTSEGNAY